MARDFVYYEEIATAEEAVAAAAAAAAVAAAAQEIVEPVHYDTKAELLVSAPALTEGSRAVADDTGEPFTVYSGAVVPDTGVVWYTAGGPPDDGVGNDGDLALDTDALAVYQRLAGSYLLLGYLKASAATEDLFSGSTAPDAALGEDGDFHIHTSTKELSRKSQTQDYSEMTLAASPRLYLRLEEAAGTSAADDSATNNDGTYVGSPTLAQTGAVTGEASNNAVQFDGVDDKITVPHVAAYNFGNTFTFEFWIKIASLPAAVDFVLDKLNGTAGGWGITLSTTGVLSLTVANGSTNDSVIDSTAISTGAWHHVVFVSNGTTDRKVYIDGVDATDATDTDSHLDASVDLVIGMEDDGTNQFAGHLDEIALYPTAQSATWVAAHYAARTATAAAAWAAFALLEHTTGKANLASDQPMTNANQYYDGPSVSLAAGTWFIAATVTCVAGGTNGPFTAKLWDGTTTEASTGGQSRVSSTETSLSLSGIVTPAVTTSYKVSVANTQAGATIKAAAPNNAAGNTASHIRAVRLA